MKISVVRKKVKHIKNLLSEYGILYATIKSVGKVKKGSAIDLDENYLFNMEKRMKKIEEIFDHLLK